MIPRNLHGLDDRDVQRYLAERAETVARRAADHAAMTDRVATGLGFLRPAQSGRTMLLRVAIVVALLALLAIAIGTGDQPPPDASPTPSSTSTPAPSTASPLPLEATGTLPIAAVTIEATDDAVWLLDASGRLAELDPVSGAEFRGLDLGPGGRDLLVTADAIWVASPASALVRVDRLSLEVTVVPGAAGGALAEGPDGIWLGAENAVLRIDPATNAVDLEVPVANRPAELGIVAESSAVWVATLTEILRLDATDGSVTGRVAGDAVRIVLAEGSIWGTRGTELVRIDPASVSAGAFIAGLPGANTLATGGGRLWVGGPVGGGPSGTIVGIGISSEQVEVRATIAAGIPALAVGAGGIWVAGEDDATIHRFALP